MTAIFTGLGNTTTQRIENTDVARLADGTFVSVFMIVDTDSGHLTPTIQRLNSDGQPIGSAQSMQSYIVPDAGYTFSDGSFDIEVLKSGAYVITLQTVTTSGSPSYQNHSVLFAPSGTVIAKDEPTVAQHSVGVEAIATTDAGYAVFTEGTFGRFDIDKVSAFGTSQFGKSLGFLTFYVNSALVGMQDNNVAVFRQTFEETATVQLHIIDTNVSFLTNAPVATFSQATQINKMAAHTLENGDVLFVYHDATGFRSRIFDQDTATFSNASVIKGTFYFDNSLLDIQFTELADGTVLMRSVTSSDAGAGEHFVQKFDGETGVRIGTPIVIQNQGFQPDKFDTDLSSKIIGTDEGGFLIVGSGDTPHSNSGTVPFTVVTHWQGTATNDIELMLEAGTFDAKAGNDFVMGSNGDDVIIGGDGDDILDGADGDDTLHADQVSEYSFGSGFDRLTGGDGNDTLINTTGQSHMSGGAGNDVIWGGDSTDTAYGGEGNDTLELGFNPDRGDGGAGQDLIRGEGGDDYLTGGTGKDVLFGGQGSDLLEGGGLKDRLIGGQGDDVLLGGGGSDILRGGSGSDVMTGGASSDRFVFVGDGPASSPLEPLFETDIITDFTQGEDKIHLDGITGINSFADLDIEAEGGGAVLTLTGREVLINGFNGTLGAEDFIFS